MAVYAGPRTPYIALKDGTIGAFFSVKNLNTLFQDVSGSIPATVNGIVGRMNDSSPLNSMTFTGVNAPILRQEKMYIIWNLTVQTIIW